VIALIQDFASGFYFRYFLFARAFSGESDGKIGVD
jgi:hypothetical protein